MQRICESMPRPSSDRALKFSLQIALCLLRDLRENVTLE